MERSTIPCTARITIKWTRLLCRSFAANAVRLQLHRLARTLATPEPIKDRSLTSLKEKLIKIGAKIVSHGRYVALQMTEVAIPKSLFADILRLIAELRPAPVTSIAKYKAFRCHRYGKLTGAVCPNNGKKIAPGHRPPLRRQLRAKSRPR